MDFVMIYIYIFIVFSDAFAPYKYAPPWSSLKPVFYSIFCALSKRLLVLHENLPWKIALCLPLPDINFHFAFTRYFEAHFITPSFGCEHAWLWLKYSTIQSTTTASYEVDGRRLSRRYPKYVTHINSGNQL